MDSLEKTRRRRPEERPGQILDAAFVEFGTRGLAGARLDDIAKRAGVAKGTIYLYFENKEALFREMVHATLGVAIEEAEALASSHISGTIESLFREYAKRWWQFLRNEQFVVIQRLVMAGELLTYPELTEFFANEVVARGRRVVAGIVQRGIDSGEFRPIDPDIAARMYSAIWFAHAKWASLKQFHAILGTDAQVLDEMTDFYLQALKK
ncbi:MAG: TetR/AcrR family transcriptional regulator [Gemmatimonadaceae bacterium]|nr:TetR/AcrR family transcriptional regulator [Gemmatimonadaceae bacterium]